MKLENFSRYEIYPIEGKVWSYKRNRYIGNKNKKDGYWYITLIDDNGKPHSFQLHRLIYMAVKGDIQEGLEVNHMDEDKDNNSIFNLNLMTHKENMNWGTAIQRKVANTDYRKIGEKQRNHPNKSKQVGQFQNNVLIMVYPSIREAGRNGFIHQHISSCCKGKLKTHKGYQWQYLS